MIPEPPPNSVNSTVLFFLQERREKFSQSKENLAFPVDGEIQKLAPTCLPKAPLTPARGSKERLFEVTNKTSRSLFRLPEDNGGSECEEKQKGSVQRLSSSGITQATNGSYQITIMGTTYGLELMGTGNYHRVYGFCRLDPEEFRRKTGIEKDPNELVLKIAKPPCTSDGILAPPREKLRQRERYLKSEYLAYNQLKKNMPIVTVYHVPHDYKNASDASNGNFWLMEKVTPVKTIDKDVIAFITPYLKKMAVEKRQLIGSDAYLRNLARAQDGSFKWMDWGSIEDDEWEFALFDYCWHYSQEGQNQEIWNFFVQEIQKVSVEVGQGLKDHLRLKRELSR